MKNSSPYPAGLKRRGLTPCCSKVGLKRGQWTPDEDEVLSNFIQREGEGRWRTLPKRAGLLRCGKSCRLRWKNYLCPSVKHGNIDPDEEDLIVRLHRLLGNRWSLIAGRIPGRTSNQIKNYWNSSLSKKLTSQGIDPRTHKPFNTQDLKLKSKAVLDTNPNANPNCPITTVAIEEVVGSSRGNILHDHHDDTWQRAEPGSHGYYGREEDMGVDYYTDDAFSSFLESLISDGMFMQPRYDQLQSDNNVTDERTAAGSTWSSATDCAGLGTEVGLLSIFSNIG